MISPNPVFGRIQLNCPKCRSRLSAPLTYAGKMARCPQCGYASVVPRGGVTGRSGEDDSGNLAWRLPSHGGHEHYLSTLNAAAAQRKPINATTAHASRPRLDLMSWILLTANVIASATIVAAIVGRML